MTARPFRDEFLRLRAEDRLRLLEEVWDSLAATERVPVPSWHVAELNRRLDDPTEATTESSDDVKRRLSPP
jgi:putative addiction module component (TIGR02574 family)